MISIPFALVENSIKKYGSDIKEHVVELKEKILKISKDKRLSATNKRYTKLILKLADNIIIAKPSTIVNYKKQFDKIVRPERMRSKKYESFRKRIIKALGYNDLRTDFYPEYFQSVGIQSCVYCNSTLTVSVERISGEKSKKELKARFQVDHYIPKSEYPCFSISLFNLYPTCASCNNLKSKNRVHFKLYDGESKVSRSPFNFELNMVSVAEYLLKRDNTMILYDFCEPPKPAGDFKTFNEVFAIQGIYDTQKTIVEELILKAEIYTASYKKILRNSFPKILNSSGITDRLILGNFTEDRDIHKRPMAKFMIDIARQVGLI